MREVLMPAPQLFSVSGDGGGQGAVWHATTGEITWRFSYLESVWPSTFGPKLAYSVAIHGHFPALVELARQLGRFRQHPCQS